MAAPCYITWSGIVPTTATTSPYGTVQSAIASQSTAGQPKTILQIATGKKIRVVEWGYLLSSAPTGPVQMELLDTNTVAATAGTIGTVLNYNDTSASTSSALVATTSQTGYGFTGEGAATANVRLLAQTYDLSTYFKQQFPLGREPEVAASCFLRVRVTPTSAAVSLLAYCIWEE